MDIIIALVIGFLFGKKLTSPLNILIEGIQQLRERRFKKMSIPKGIYEDVFRNMNELSVKLDQYEIERNQLDRMREECVPSLMKMIRRQKLAAYASCVTNMMVELLFSFSSL